MNNTIIVEGPMGCGKTRNAKRIAKHLRCRTIIEGDEWRGGEERWRKLPRPILVLTINASETPSFMREFAMLRSFDSLPRDVLKGAA